MGLRFLLALAAVGAASAQVVQFESGGLKYLTLSKAGVTVMIAQLPAHLHEYTIYQVGVMNGSPATWTIRTDDVFYQRDDGGAVRAAPPKSVVDNLLAHASRNDVVSLISTYENGLNGVTRFRSTNGYEQRRQAALAEFGSHKLRAAAAASAIAFVQTKLAPGESTDGAVFFSTGGKPLGAGHIVVRTAGQTFDFKTDPDAPTKTLQQRGNPG